jgi:hypothetical protein
MNSAMLVVVIVLHAFFLTASTASIHGSWDGALDRNTTNVESYRDLCGINPNNEEDFDNSFVTTLNFRQIGPALNVNESIMYLNDRRERVLIYLANQPLPTNETGDDLEYDPFRTETNTNPRLNSRFDVRQLVARTVSRILLGCSVNDTEEILLDPRTKPFSLPGTSERASGIPCYRDGDYDFALMDLLQLAFVARANPGSLSEQAMTVLEQNLLSVHGPIRSTSYELQCYIKGPLTGINYTIWLEVDDTENHVMMTETARYLTNQILRNRGSPYSTDARYDNVLNGNKVWMLEHLASFMRSSFYEYNSKPYQGATIVALNLLHTFAHDEEVVLAAEMLLDMITAWMSVQSDQLRRFVPFRRQPEYVEIPQSWSGDSEDVRLSVLVGSTTELPEIRTTELLSASISKYRINNIILDLFFPSNDNTSTSYFVGNTQVAEIYAGSKHVLISAGGHSNPFRLGSRRITPTKRPLNFNIGRGYFFYKLFELIFDTLTDEERGWSRPTTIIPRNQSVNFDIQNMMRFVGNRDSIDGAKGQNLCVAPGFACGLAFTLGNIIGAEEIKNQCSMTAGNWTFFSLIQGRNVSTICPNYGFFAAMYVQQCDTEVCSSKADDYGLLEIQEQNKIGNLDFNQFQLKVLENNPGTFSSNSTNTYITVSGERIIFVIDPLDGQSSIVEYNGTRYDRNYQQWPIAKSDTIQSTTPGRLTIDNPKIGERLILDMTVPMLPKRFESKIPQLWTSQQNFGQDYGGREFNDGSAIVLGKHITKVTVYTNIFSSLIGIYTEWQSGLFTMHGVKGILSKTLFLSFDEYIVEAGIGTSWFGNSANYLRLQTNHGQHIASNRFGLEKVTVVAEEDEQIGAFYGRAGKLVYQLGVVLTST